MTQTNEDWKWMKYELVVSTLLKSINQLGSFRQGSGSKSKTCETTTQNTSHTKIVQFFPTCQVRVVRFYVSPCPPPSPPLPPRPPLITATICVQFSLPDLNLVLLYCDHLCPVFSAGPQPRPFVASVPCQTSTRPSAASVPCRTSTATIHGQCSLPDLNREAEDLPDRAPERMSDRMPESMSEEMSERVPEQMPERISDRMSEHTPERMSEQDISKESQTECQKRCQKECQKRCQTECRKECQKRCQKDCQKRCQKECQKRRQKPERMRKNVRRYGYEVPPKWFRHTEGSLCNWKYIQWSMSALQYRESSSWLIKTRRGVTHHHRLRQAIETSAKVYGPRKSRFGRTKQRSTNVQQGLARHRSCPDNMQDRLSRKHLRENKMFQKHSSVASRKWQRSARPVGAGRSGRGSCGLWCRALARAGLRAKQRGRLRALRLLWQPVSKRQLSEAPKLQWFRRPKGWTGHRGSGTSQQSASTLWLKGYILVPDRMSGDMQRISGRMPQDLPERMSEDMSERLSERMSGEMPERMSDRKTGDMPNRMPERMSEDVPERLSERMPEDMAERI